MALADSRLMLACVLLTLVVALPVSAESDTVRTKAPQEHVDAFMSDCKAKNIPVATCVCMLKTLSQTREGDAALDALGLVKYRHTDAERRAGMVPLLNRHGLRGSELQAIMGSQTSLLQNVAKQCV
jgi:hypothetical protein